MIKRLKQIIFLLRQFGFKWFLFRVGYAIRIHSGWFRIQAPAYQWEDHPLSSWLKAEIPFDPVDYGKWRLKNLPDFFLQTPIEFPDDCPWDPQLAVDEGNRLLSGELKFFEHDWYRLGFPPDWFFDPRTEKHLDAAKHWSGIEDFGEYDIKFFWEASRFSQVYTLVRAYSVQQDEKFAETFWLLIEDWAKRNLPGRGPNWKCGQEASLRLMAWCFGFYGFKSASATTPVRVSLLTRMSAGLSQRIHQDLPYAISTRSNHTISEGFGLYLTGVLFPELKSAEQYRHLGRKILEQEAVIQIFEDGTYSMYSLNYQRFILHIYLYALRLAEVNAQPFAATTYHRVAAAVNFLYQIIDTPSGQMPEFGSNDGALILPLNSCSFSDYRPLIQSTYYLVNKKRLFKSGPWDEDLFWLFGKESLEASIDQEIEQSSINFFDGGIFCLRNTNSKAVIRCIDYKERPSQADQLHVDLWWHGENIACDAGTFLYNGPGIWRNGLAHSSVHNTVTVDQLDQMDKFSHFTWSNWAKGSFMQETSTSGIQVWQGQHDGYQRLADPVSHIRTVLMLPDDRWLVLDRLHGLINHEYFLHWLINDFPFEQFPGDNKIILWQETKKYLIMTGLLEGNPDFSVVRASENSTRGWRSRAYGSKEAAISVALQCSQSEAVFWTYFGSGSDSIYREDGCLLVKAGTGQLRINMELLINTSDLKKGFITYIAE
jgi:asparagine synthase (glutamine-hydrolysing)